MNPLQLLVIEDDMDQRELICETLEQTFGSGTTRGVGTAKEALAQELARFDLILSDYNLPDASGLELLEQIRAKCETPFIMVTGENDAATAADAIGRGATDYVVKLGDYLFTIPLVILKNLRVAQIKRDNQRLQVELQQALSEVREKNTQLEQSLKRVEEMAATDPLTGLYNRRHFGKVIDQLFSEAQRYGRELSCVMIDLDGYKQLNDTCGHQLGDQMLQTVGTVLKANMRRSDVAARYGGDEFVLLLAHAEGDMAEQVAKRISQEFATAAYQLLGREPKVTMSVGISSLVDGKPTQAEQLVAQADKALYRAKQEGRNRIIRDVTPRPELASVA